MHEALAIRRDIEHKFMPLSDTVYAEYSRSAALKRKDACLPSADRLRTVGVVLTQRNSETLCRTDQHIRPVCLAQSPVFLRFPKVGPDRCDCVEQVQRIILRLDGLELGVVGAVEDFLEVRLSEVSLVEIGRAIGSQLCQFWHKHFCHQLLACKHLLPRSGEVPGSSDDCVDECVAPAGVDGVVRMSSDLERC